MNLSRVVFSATILLTFPIECLVIRAIVETLWDQLDSYRSHTIATVAIVFAAYFVSVSTDCLGVVLELNVSNPSVVNGRKFALVQIKENSFLSSLKHSCKEHNINIFFANQRYKEFFKIPIKYRNF